MKKTILMLCTCLFPLFGFGHNELDGKLKEFYSKNKIQGNSQTVDDYTWLRRVYIDLAGRIPTQKEIDIFINYQAPDKKHKLVDKILFSEDYVNNYYNFWADIFRIRPERLSDDVGLLRSYPYIQYIKDFIRSDRPYNTVVNELLTAKGRFTENPATGYMLRDTGMPLDNLATSLQLFIGTDIACAQCHDDPFQDYSQKQFYEMASFFSSLDLREPRKDYADVLKKVDAEIKEITKQDRIDNNVRQLLSSNLFKLSDNDKKTIKLPHDYKYDDAKPFDVVEPASLDNKIKNVNENRRELASKWIVNHDNFPRAVSNRIWNSIVGKPLISPETNFNVKDYPEGEILVFLGNYLKSNDYSIKKLVRLIVLSDFYNRVAYKDNINNFKHQAVLVKRLNSYQLWDSLLTLVIPDVNYTRISFEKYSSLVQLDWNSINGKDLLNRMEQIRAYEKSLNDNFLKYKNIDLVRSSYILNKNGFVGQFLREYGSSDRILIDSSDDKGSITQNLMMMNSPIAELISNKNSVSYNKSKQDLFLSILGRKPTIQEYSMINTINQDDLVWILINSKEFLFRK